MPLTISVLASGSSGNATLVATSQTRILVDAGLSTSETHRRLAGLGYDLKSINGILITHAHSDHYRAAGSLSRQNAIPVFAPEGTTSTIRSRSSKKRHRRIKEILPVPNTIGDISISCFPVQHGGEARDAGEPVGFVLGNGDATFAVATDVGAPTAPLREGLRGSTAILIESNYDEDRLNRKLSDPDFDSDWEYLNWVKGGYGHLSNRQCAEVLASVMTKATTDIFLAHISENHPEPRSDNNSFELARDTVLETLEQAEAPIPAIHRTYRSGLRKGQPSILLQID